MIRNYLAVLEYDGTKYNGWQKQGNTENTIQGKLEVLLSRLLEQDIEVNGAGRTDKGVHALGQRASFRCDTSLSPGELMAKVNEFLPRDIAIKSLETVPPRFHARINARGKTYRYTLIINGEKSVFSGNYAWSMTEAPDIGLMKAAAQHLLGEHDFLPFSDLKKSKKSTIRRIDDIDIKKDGNRITIDFTGNGFLYHMVRRMVSALTDAGLGKLAPAQLGEALASGSGSFLPPPAPARGLFLLDVYYK